MEKINNSNSKKIVVTGGLGFIGSNFVELALERGYKVVNIDKVTYAARNDLEFDKNPNYEFIQCDIANLPKLPDGIDCIVNFAAESHVENSINENKVFLQSNIRGVHNILELLRKTPSEKRPLLVHISTDEVYGDMEEGSFNEDDRLNPSNPYSATKAAADQLILGWARTYGIKYRIVRSSNNYGYGQHAEKLIPRTIKLLSKGQKMTVHGDGSYRREWTNVRDNCEAVLLVMEKGKDGEIYNVSTGEYHTNLQVIKMVLKAMELPEDHYVFAPNRPGQDIRYSVDASKVKSLGWQPKMSVEKYIPLYLESAKIGRSKIKQGLQGKIKNFLSKNK